MEDPWTEPITLAFSSGDDQLVYNGEGTLLYPGYDAGFDGLASSLRLKAMRDSIEDYEYLAILQRAGLEQEARPIVERLATSWTNWNPDPNAYEEARAELAELIIEAAIED